MSRLLAKLFPKRFNARSSLTELAADVWAIDDRLGPLLEEIAQKVLSASVVETAEAEQECREEDGCPYMKVEASVAHIPIDGLLVSRGAGLFRYFGIAATGYNEINLALAEAENRDDIKEVVLHVNSPGGSVTGLQSTASKIYRLGRFKPVSAHASGIVASAAYWLASQANFGFTAEEGTEVGSIGVYATVEDSSRMFEDAGIKVHMLRSGEHKGVGEPGVPVTDRQLNKLQKSVKRSSDEFIAAIARGRDLKQSEVERLATGETWPAKDAVDLRLIDGVESIDDSAIDTPITAPDGASTKELDRMSTNKNEGAVDLAAMKEQLLAEVRKDFDLKLETRLQEERAHHEAELAKANASITGLKEDQKKKLIDQAAADGRIAPAQRESIEAFAKVSSVEQVASFVGALPRQTNPDHVGSAGGSANSRRVVGSDESQLAGLLGIDAKLLNGPLAEARGVMTDGRVVLADGSIVSAKEVMN